MSSKVNAGSKPGMSTYVPGVCATPSVISPAATGFGLSWTAFRDFAAGPDRGVREAATAGGRE